MGGWGVADGGIGHGHQQPACIQRPSSCPLVCRSFTIRQNTYMVARSCEVWRSRFEPAFRQAAISLTGLKKVTLQCQYAGSIGISNSRLRVGITGKTGIIQLSDAKLLANSFNKGVVSGTYAQLVQRQLNGTAPRPKRADGYCVVKFTKCPPRDPVY